MELIKRLNDANASVETIANSWCSQYRINAAEAFTFLSELMFQAGGWIDFKYKYHGIPSIETFKNIKEFGPLSLTPLIMKSEEDFQSTFRHFISLIAEHDGCRLLYDQCFFKFTCRIFEILYFGRWDAFKLVAFITGKELWNCLEKGLVEKKQLPLQHWQILLKEHKWPYFWNQDELKLCYDFLSWSISSPTVLITQRWHHTILNWMRTKSTEGKAIAFMAVFNLFRNEINKTLQYKLMKYLKADLFYALHVKSTEAEISMRTLVAAIRFMDILMNQAEIECIIAQLYDPIETHIALLAGKLFCTTNVARLDDFSSTTIINLLEINNDFYIGSEDLLIDSIFLHMRDYWTWKDWVQIVFDSPTDYAGRVLILLCAYVRKATRNFSPTVRVKQVVEALIKKKDLDENSRKFTEVFSSAWLEIASLNKIRISVPHKLAELAQYFDNSLEPKIIKEIAYILCGLHCYTTECIVSDESCKSLAHLVHIIDNLEKCEDTESAEAVHVIVYSLSRLAQRDFILILSSYPTNLSHIELALPQNILIMKKMLSVNQWLTFDDSEMWHFAVDKLTSILFLLFNNSLVEVLLTLLFQMVMKSADEVIAVQKKRINKTLKSQDKVNNMVQKFVSRALRFKLEARHFLNRQYSPTLRSTTYYALCDLLEYTLANFQNQNQFLAQLTSFDEEEIDALRSYCLEFMKYSQTDAYGCCCFAINRLCNLISRGFIDVQVCLTPFIKQIGKNAIHDEIIIKCLYDYSWLFPHKWENITITIFNSLVSIIDDTFMKYKMMECVEEYENAFIWTSVQNLVKILIEGKIKEPVLRTACLKLHTHVIHSALGPSGHSSLLRVLYLFKHVLVPEDLSFVVSFLLQYYSCEAKPNNLKEIEAYLKQLNWFAFVKPQKKLVK